METSGVYYDSLEMFFLSVKLENIRIGTSLNILVTQSSKLKANRYFRARNMLPRNNAGLRIVEKLSALISKQSSLPS